MSYRDMLLWPPEKLQKTLDTMSFSQTSSEKIYLNLLIFSFCVLKEINSNLEGRQNQRSGNNICHK